MMKQLIPRISGIFIILFMLIPFLIAPDSEIKNYVDNSYISKEQPTALANSISYPPDAIWSRVYNAFPSGDNVLQSVIQLDSDDLAATGGHWASHLGQPSCWDYYTIRTDSEGGGADDAQDWTDYYWGSGCDRAMSIVQVPGQEDVVIAGYYTDDTKDIHLRRLNISGGEVWTRSFSEVYDQSANQIIACNTGGFAIAGYNQTKEGWLGDFFLLRTLANGFEDWKVSYGGGGWDEATTLVECANGDFVLAGYTQSYGGLDKDLWVVRFSSTGAYVWDRVYGGDFDDWGEHIIECEDGGFAIVGSTLSYGGSDRDLWLLRLNSTGHKEWQQVYGNSSDDWGMSIVECEAGGFAITGTTYSYSVGSGDVWLLRTNSTGHLHWSNSYGGDYEDTGWSIITGNDAGFIISGGTRSWGGSDMDGLLLKVADPPVWLEEPHDQNVTYGDLLYYGLEATATYIDKWWLNDTEHFSIDASGIVSSNMALPIGVYGIQVSLNDTLGNVLTGSFNVRVIYSPTLDSRDAIWERTYGGNLDDRAQQLAKCREGGYAIAGYGRSFGAGDFDAWFGRFDAFGNLLWNRTYGTTGQTDCVYSLIECNNGDFVMAGASTNFTQPYFDAWLIRTDSNGNLIWSNGYGGADTDNATSIVECTDGGLVATGYTEPTAGNKDLWLFKVNATGHLNWSRSVSFPNKQEGLSILEYNNTRLVIAGYNETAGAGLNFRQGMLYIANSDGTLNATHNYGGSSRDEFRCVIKCENGDLAMTGLYTKLGTQAVWLIRVASDGSIIFTEDYGFADNNYGTSLVECYYGGFAIAANTWGPNGSSQNALLIRANASGDYLWSHWYGGSDTDRITSIVECINGGYAIAGHTQSIGAGGFDVWLFKVQPVQWIEFPEDQVTEFGAAFSYNLSVLIMGVSHAGIMFEGNEYKLFTTEMNWTSARDDCENRGGHLVTITSAEENLFVYSLVGIYQSHIGFTDAASETNWRWITGDDYSYTNWNAGQPDNYLGIEHWAEMDQTGFWNDIPENQKQYYVCEWDYPGNVDTWYLNNTLNFTLVDYEGTVQIDNTSQFSPGVYELYMLVNLTSGDFLNASFKITVEPAMKPAWVEVPTDQIVEFGQSFAYQLRATDTAGIDTWIVNDTKFSINETGLITNASSLAIGIYGLRIQVNDTLGNTTIANISITVQDTTPPSWINEPQDQYLEYGTVLSYSIGASDLSGIDTWWVDNTTYVNITQSGILVQQYLLPVCVFNVLISVNDTIGNVRYVDLTITIHIDPPAWAVTPTDQISEYAQDFRYLLLATALGGIDSWWVNDTGNFTVDEYGVVSSIGHLAVGEYGLQVWVNDTWGQAISAEFSVTVIDSLAPTWVKMPENVTIEYGAALFIPLNATDPSGISHWSINNTTHFGVTSTGRVMNTTTLEPGVYWLTVTVFDIYDNAQAVTFAVTVLETQAPEWIEFPTDQTVEFGSDFMYKLQVYDYSGIGSWWISDSINFQISEDGTLRNALPLHIGVYELEVEVTDIIGNADSVTFDVIVVDTTSPFWIEPPVNQAIEYGDQLIYQLKANDLSGISLWTVNDTAQFQISGTGLLTNTPNLRAGVHYIEITVFDPYGNSASAEIAIIVSAVEAGRPVVTLAVTMALGITGIVIIMMFCLARRRSVAEMPVNKDISTRFLRKIIMLTFSKRGLERI